MSRPAGDLAARPFDAAAYQIYRAWVSDSARQPYISITPEWFAYVTQTPHVHAWMIFEGEIPVAVVQFDAEPLPAVSVEVNAALHGRGYCRRVLRLIFQQPEFHPYETVYGFIDPDNVASLRCVAGLDFAHAASSLDSDGLIEITFALKKLLPLN